MHNIIKTPVHPSSNIKHPNCIIYLLLVRNYLNTCEDITSVVSMKLFNWLLLSTESSLVTIKHSSRT